jgi:hypothetical protein
LGISTIDWTVRVEVRAGGTTTASHRDFLLRAGWAASPKAKALQAAWLQKKAEIFAGKYHIPDSEDPDTVNHLNWYEATGFTRPYPGEKTVRPASDFNRPAPAKADLDD